MKQQEKFIEAIKSGYEGRGKSIVLGGAVVDGKAVPGLFTKIPLRMLNRHGLIAGATGTGKTKTLQVFAEALSLEGIPSLLMDIKGDLSGLGAPGASHPKIEERHQQIGIPWKSSAFPIEFLTISQEKGTRLRATISEFGPVLFSKILELNDTQAGIVSLIFKYCDDHQMPLLDLKDFKKTLQYLTNEGKEAIEKEYGRISTASSSTIIRKIIEIEQQGATIFFGELSFEVEDLLRIDENGKGYLHVMRLADIQDKPKMFSTFMLSLLAEIYATYPEEGDLDQPKLVIVIDEAHLIFKEASKALLNQIETIIKLIRSKGVGIFFSTQQPTDIPASVLSQLGLKIQHALRAFTAVDRKTLKTVAENYPLSDFYKTEDLLTQLGIGEALVTALNEKGIPTPLVHTLLCAPQSRMDILQPDEIDNIIRQSMLIQKYNTEIDRESAFEILNKKLESIKVAAPSKSSSSPQQKGMIEEVVNSTAGRQVMRTVARELTRGLLGVLGVGGRRRTSRKGSGWFN